MTCTRPNHSPSSPLHSTKRFSSLPMQEANVIQWISVTLGNATEIRPACVCCISYQDMWQILHTHQILKRYIEKWFLFLTAIKHTTSKTIEHLQPHLDPMNNDDVSDDRKAWRLSCNSWWYIMAAYPSSSERRISSLIQRLSQLAQLHGHTNSTPTNMAHRCAQTSLLGWLKLMVKPTSMRENRSERFTLPLAAIILRLARRPLVLWWWRHDERKPLFHLCPISRVLPPAFPAAIKPACRFLCRIWVLTTDLFRSEAVAPLICSILQHAWYGIYWKIRAIISRRLAMHSLTWQFARYSS